MATGWQGSLMLMCRPGCREAVCAGSGGRGGFGQPDAAQVREVGRAETV
jgi:hypothetical protein